MSIFSSKNVSRLALVAALGYFVDVYDLLLFNVIKGDSLKDLGLSGIENEAALLNFQMFGMLLGGIMWGILGDKKGRVTVLFGSILTYSIANLANAFVVGFWDYALWRFIAGFGLAGELGAGVTLVSETMEKEKRGIGTMIIVSFGVLGAVVAVLVHEALGWQNAFIVGGLMGLALLLLRAGALESGMFEGIKKNDAAHRGDFFHLITKDKTIRRVWEFLLPVSLLAFVLSFLMPAYSTLYRVIFGILGIGIVIQMFNDARFRKYMFCILLGMPIWYVIGILVSFSNRFAVVTGVTGDILVPTAVAFCYLGLSIGDFSSGLLSQKLRSRKKAILSFLVLMAVVVLAFLFLRGLSPAIYYGLCFMLGFSAGYWAIFVQNASEQFGTNLRSTVTNTVPNFVRGGLVAMSAAFLALIPNPKVPDEYFIHSALIVGAITIAIAVFSTLSIQETFSKDLDYVEE
ncbi:MAG TPA: MFS transporter [Rhodothermales bacterium]|nr:MFS transporter [Rhodothermales bacterium]